MAPEIAQPDLFTPPVGAPPPGNSIVDGVFWLVICTEAMEDRGRTMLTRGYRYVHETEESANKEAVRLATKYRGYEFAVVRSCAAVRFSEERRRPMWAEWERT